MTGGVPGEATVSEDNGIDRLYIAGYQDGSIRIWDATHPILSQMLVLDDKVRTKLFAPKVFISQILLKI